MVFNEKGTGKEQVSVGASLQLKEHGNWHCHLDLYKFYGDYPGMTAKEIIDSGVEPYEIFRHDGNQLQNDGINATIWPAVVGAAPTYINGTDGCIGIGDSNTAATATQDALQAATNHLWVLLSGTPTTGSSQAIVASASFSTTQANWVWNEICLGCTTTPASLPANATTPPATFHILNRLVSAMGTKVSTATWVPTLTITLS